MSDTDQRRVPSGPAGTWPGPLAGAPAGSPAPSPAAAAGDPVAEAVRAALAVPGVSGVRVERDADGAALLRLELVDGADEDDVARAVTEQLQRAAVPAPAPAPPPEHAPPPARPQPAPRPRTGRVPGPSVSSPTVAATPAPQWLGEGPAAAVAGTPSAPSAPGAPGAPGAPTRADRVRLQRVQVVTEGLTTTATVVLASGSTSHTGIAEAAATPTGGQRCLATAALRALESAAQGRLRAGVDAVGVQDLGGQRCVLVLLSTVTAGGPEQLVGAALAGDDVPGAVVRAVLAAGNRRLAPGAADPASGRGR